MEGNCQDEGSDETLDPGGYLVAASETRSRASSEALGRYFCDVNGCSYKPQKLGVIF